MKQTVLHFCRYILSSYEAMFMQKQKALSYFMVCHHFITEAKTFILTFQ